MSQLLNGIFLLAEQMTKYLREEYSLCFVSHDAMIALSGWMHGSNTPSDVIYAMLNKAAWDLAEGVDPKTGAAVFADPREHHYMVPERVLSELLDGK